MNSANPVGDYPNVRARLHWTKMAPALPPREGYVEIWMKGSRFHVRDESGRHVSSILGDLSALRGLGEPAHSIEEMMDAWSQSRESRVGATELYGDRTTEDGRAYRRGQTWLIPSQQLAPAAEQILAGESYKRLSKRAEATRLGRAAVEFHGFIEGEEESIGWKTEVIQVVSLPFLLFSEARDAVNPARCYTREIIIIEIGAVSDTDLTPLPRGQ